MKLHIHQFHNLCMKLFKNSYNYTRFFITSKNFCTLGNYFKNSKNITYHYIQSYTLPKTYVYRKKKVYKIHSSTLSDKKTYTRLIDVKKIYIYLSIHVLVSCIVIFYLFPLVFFFKFLLDHINCNL